MSSSDFREFQQIWQPRIAAEIYAFTGDRGAAGEIAQEVFSLAGSRWTRLERQEDPVRWSRQEAWQRVDERWLGTSRPGGDESAPAMVAALAELPPSTRRTVVLLLAEVPSHEYVALGATAIPAAQWDEALEYLATALPGHDPATLFAQLCTGWEITVPRARMDAEPPKRARSHSLAPTRRSRRKGSLVALGAVALLVAGVVGVTKWAAEPAGGSAAPEVSASATPELAWPEPSATEEPLPTPSGTTAPPTAPPSAQPGASPGRPTPSPTRPGTSPRPGNPPASPTKSPTPSPSPPCQVSVNVTATGPDSGGALEFTAEAVGGKLEFCGTQRAVWWASYTLGEDGVLHRAGSGTQNLNKDAPTWSTTIAFAPCGGAWYYGVNAVSFPDDIQVADQDAAFGGNKLDHGASPC
ncbi:hypothetical protein [Catellatospora coxensis]|uniref:DNA-directed RNA polymerase specialized sigma24 family protein n=1 Tax=Catellatospora coxensis TaxID=310354 RepID=A0A8J3L362_9ACTN|nr:hypothetical protein [Catellatospora coxensis]GIG06865.1 hypothetical protein Cco03nite_35650 [Catellatospora coxensis]